MLDTRMPPISTRTRRSPSAASQTRPLASRAADSAPAGRHQAARELSTQDPAAVPARRSLPSARTSRLARSEMRLMGLATACTAIVCGLLLLYLAAYAHVTQLGIAQAQARTQLHQNQLRNALLQAERNSLESPQRIEAAAAAQGMTPRGPTAINYVTARSVEEASETSTGDSGGKTENSSAAASRDY